MLVRTCLVLCLVAAAAGAVWGQDRAEARRLLKSGEDALNSGNQQLARQYFAQAWSVMATIYWNEGNGTAAREAWSSAQKFGWRGSPPWVKKPAARESLQPAPVRPEPVKPYEPREGAIPRFRQEEPPWKREQVRPGRRPAVDDFWPVVARAPHSTGRNGIWHSLVHIPDLEEAREFPFGYWHVRGSFNVNSGDFEDSSEGGLSQWNADLIEEVIGVDYSPSNNIVVGLRLSAGELFEKDDDLITAWDAGTQIVPDGDRGFGLTNIVARGKYVGDLGGFANWGALAAIKVSVADEENLLSSGSFDASLTGILTKDLGKYVSVTVNLGIVMPVGDSDIFVSSSYDDLGPVFQGGLAVAVQPAEMFSFIAQIEGNTSPFSDVSILEEATFAAHGGVRVRIRGNMHACISAGTGFGDLGADYTLAGSAGIIF